MKKSWFTEKVTIYNRYKNPDTKKDEWIRSIVDGCLWLKSTSKTVDSKNEVVLASNVDLMILSNEMYNYPKTWQKAHIGFTLQEGDLIVYGECSDEISDNIPFGTVRKNNKSIEIRAVEVFNKPFMCNKHYEVMGV